MDFMFDPDTQNLVELEVAWEKALGDDWSGYRPAPVSVAVIDLPTPACQVTLQFLLHPRSQYGNYLPGVHPLEHHHF